MGDRVTVGTVGEHYAKILLEAHGYLVDIDHQPKRGDLRVITPDGDILRVEVKTARPSKRGYFEYNLAKWRNGKQSTCSSGCDVLILLGVNRAGLVEIYVLPQKAAANINVIKIPANCIASRSTWRQYRQWSGNVSLKAVSEARRNV